MKNKFAFLIIISAIFFSLSSISEKKQFDKDSILDIKKYVTEKPVFFGFDVTNREQWGKIKNNKKTIAFIQRAEKYLNTPLPKMTDQLFLDFSKTGNRSKWQKVSSERRNRIKYYVIAECLENNGRFINSLEELITDLCRLKTWVKPAHDKNLENFYQKTIDIDLDSSALAWELALTIRLLKEKLKPAIVSLIKNNINKRIFIPFKQMVNGEKKENFWMQGTNNWNAVCLSGVTGAALTLLDSQEERAFYILVALHYSKNFLNGFSEDGYCSEGVGYWNYGFGNYILLSEIILRSTQNHIDLLKDEKVKKIAEYGFNIEINEGIIPAFADCSIDAKPERRILDFLNRRLKISSRKFNENEIEITSRELQHMLFYLFPNSGTLMSFNFSNYDKPQVSFFDKHGVLICRPVKNEDASLACAIKGGNNDEHHNHNDVGSYVVAIGNDVVLADPGSEVYTARTFSSKRYESKVLNSYGHPVPVINGKLQETGAEAKAVILQNDFSDKEVVFKMDLKNAYKVDGLIKLTREFIYSREKNCSLKIIDNVEYSIPKSFETALITFGSFKIIDKSSFLVFGKSQIVKCTIQCKEDIVIDSEVIKEDVNADTLPTRISIKIKGNVKQSFITILVEPYLIDENILLKNGDFEHQNWGWDLSKESMGKIVNEKTFNGNYSLKIEDNDIKNGSNINSVRILINEKTIYTLTGNVFVVSGDGLGIYIKYFDNNNNLLNDKSEKGYVSSLGKLGGANKQWTSFSFSFQTPPEAHSIILWIHSYNSAKITAYLDALYINKQK